MLGKVCAQSARGECVRFVNFTGNGRAVMHVVLPRINRAQTWHPPPCNDNGAANDSPIVDPNLPALESPSGFPAFPGFFAMADSYSAGIGAGEHIKDGISPKDMCRRNAGAYSHQLYTTEKLLRSRSFDFISSFRTEMKYILFDERKFKRPVQLIILENTVGLVPN